MKRPLLDQRTREFIRNNPNFNGRTLLFDLVLLHEIRKNKTIKIYKLTKWVFKKLRLEYNTKAKRMFKLYKIA